MIGKRLRKTIRPLVFIFCVLKKKKYVILIPQINLNCEKQIILLMIPNEEKEG